MDLEEVLQISINQVHLVSDTLRNPVSLSAQLLESKVVGEISGVDVWSQVGGKAEMG